MTNDNLDGICGASMLLGLPKATTALVEFTGTVTREARRTYAPISSGSSPSPAVDQSRSGTFEPTREAIDSRLSLLQGNEYVLPVEGRYWQSLTDHLSGKEPHYKGEIGREKAVELGLYDSSKAVVRVYADGVTFPLVKAKE